MYGGEETHTKLLALFEPVTYRNLLWHTVNTHRRRFIGLRCSLSHTHPPPKAVYQFHSAREMGGEVGEYAAADVDFDIIERFAQTTKNLVKAWILTSLI